MSEQAISSFAAVALIRGKFATVALICGEFATVGAGPPREFLTVWLPYLITIPVTDIVPSSSNTPELVNS